MFRGYMFTSMKMKTPITRRLPTYRISPIRAIGFHCAPARALGCIAIARLCQSEGK